MGKERKENEARGEREGKGGKEERKRQLSWWRFERKVSGSRGGDYNIGTRASTFFDFFYNGHSPDLSFSSPVQPNGIGALQATSIHASTNLTIHSTSIMFSCSPQ